jgi:Holliday junction resolvase
MLESSIQKKISNYLSGLPDCWNVKVMSANKRGTPDILAVINGRFVAIEVKTEKGKASAIQQAQIRRIQQAGGVAFIAKSVDEVIENLAISDIALD